ncbi:hypothetical protein ACOCJ7_18770 [Knoellia sp. CPCC 206453]|uniref:hypothetical protein n=1 Tax=Knoellia pratensis TaxID=3404796 RepID=UPI0036088B70
MSETSGSTGTQHDTTRELGAVDFTGDSGDSAAGSAQGGAGRSASDPTASSSGPATSGTGDSKDVAKEEARATGAQAKEGARHVAEVGMEEAKNVGQEGTKQAKELWQQTRSQLMDQSAQQQTRVADGLRSLSQELSSMAQGSSEQGVASDLAQQASQRMGDVAGWLDQRDPGSLVSEVKQFARQRPGTFLAAAAVIGLVGGRISRGLVADHQEQADSPDQTGGATGAPVPVHTGTPASSPPASTASAVGTSTSAGPYSVTDTEVGGAQGGTMPAGGAGTATGTGAGEYPR